MIFDWYKVINRAEFLATGLVSRELDLILEGIGAKTVLVTVANTFAITIDDVFLPVQFKGENPYVFAERAVYLDGNDDVWYGIQVS